MGGDGSRVRISQVTDDGLVSWRERRVHAYELFQRKSDVRGHQSVFVESSSHTTAGDPDLTEEQCDWDGQECELDARVLAPLYSSAGRRFRGWENVALDSFACIYEDHPVTGRDESDITAVELAALHDELAVDPLCWFADFSVEKHWHSSDAVLPAVAGADPNLVHSWHVRPTEFGRCGSYG